MSQFAILFSACCPPHHRREYGPGAFHYSPRAFYALHGDSKLLLAKVEDALRGELTP